MFIRQNPYTAGSLGKALSARDYSEIAAHLNHFQASGELDKILSECGNGLNRALMEPVSKEAKASGVFNGPDYLLLVWFLKKEDCWP
jgi:hypothetical protein